MLCCDGPRCLSLHGCAVDLAAPASPNLQQGKDLSDAELQDIMTEHDLDHNGVFDEVWSDDYSLKEQTMSSAPLSIKMFSLWV